MTIEYKDSKRITALSTDYVPNISDTSDSNWTVTGSDYAINSGVIDWEGVRSSGVDGIHIDLGAGNISDTQWVLRFKMVTDAVSSPSSGSNIIHIAVSDAGVQPQATGSEDSVGYYERRHNSSAHKQTVAYGDEANLLENVNDFNTTAPTAETKYIEMKRTSATSFTVTRYSDEFVTPKETAKTITIPETLQSLRYIKIQNKQESANGGTFNGTISDIKFWNDTTTAGVSAKNHLTNVQNNSLLVEKDTARRYWFTASSDFDFSASSSGAVSNQPTDATEVGQLITSTTHRGKKAKSATFYVKRVGSPSGTMVYKIRKSSDNSVVATSTGTSASALSTSTTAVTLNFNDEVIPSENIRVTVSGVTGSSGNLVTVMGGGADTVADQRLSVWGGSSWTEYDNDCAGKLTFTESWTMQPTKEDNFSSWVTSNSAKFVYNSTNNNIDILNSNAYDNIYYDLGSVSDTKWLCKFKVTLTTAGSQSLGFAYFYVGSTTGDANESNDGLGFYFYDNANNTYALADNGNRPDQTTVTGALGISPSTTTYYAEMKRTSATSFTVTLYSDSSYSTSLGTATLTVSSGITGLQYFKIMGYNTTGGLVGTLDDFKFYNGVTSVN